MASVGDGLQEALDGSGKMGDVGADVPVASGDDFCQPSVVISGDKCQAVQLPGEPDGFSFCPSGKVFNLFGLCQRQGRKLMFLFLSGYIVGRDILCRGVGEDDAGLFFQLLEPVEGSVPLVVGHEFFTAVVVSIGGSVELLDKGLYFFVHCFRGIWGMIGVDGR